MKPRIYSFKENRFDNDAVHLVNADTLQEAIDIILQKLIVPDNRYTVHHEENKNIHYLQVKFKGRNAFSYVITLYILGEGLLESVGIWE